MPVVVRKMRRLPLHRLAGRTIVAMAVRPMVVVTLVVAFMAVMVAVIMIVRVMIVVHGQKLTGLSMIALCLPSVPCATIEPSASTTTRTPNSAVMSEVS